MRFLQSRIAPAFFALLLAGRGYSATFGTVVPVRGTVADIALDERRGRLYAANFSAYQVEVMDTAKRALVASMPVSRPPSALAMSPDNRYLVVGEFAGPFETTGGYTVFDLDAGSRQDVEIESNVLTVAFGGGSKALMVTNNGVLLLDPASATTTVVSAVTMTCLNLPVPLATFPSQIAQASSNVSGDGKTIVVLASAGSDPGSPCSSPAAPGPEYLLMRYSIVPGTLSVEGFVTSPTLGPVSVAVDGDATNAVAGWILFHHIERSYNWAQFPNITGALNIGTNAWDIGRNVIYSQQTVAGDGAVLHVVDTDNLTVRERIQLPENLAGKSVISSDDQTMYSVSISGVTVLPIGRLNRTPQIGTLEEDLVFQGDSCNRQVITQTLDVVDFGNAGGDFTLSVPAGTSGIRILTPRGTAPAKVQIQVDPAVFQKSKGTTVVPLTISTSAGVNLPFPVRLLINTKDFDQHGTVADIPGTIVDMLADPSRARVYALRQDKNLVLVYDSTTLKPLASMRTGNTPVRMSITADQHYLIVGNDNSQIASVFDLNTLQPSDPILFPFGQYPRTIGTTLTDTFATVRLAFPPVCPDTQGAAYIDHIDMATRLANTPASLGIYQNCVPSADGALAESPSKSTLLWASPDGNVMLYDAAVGTWVASRQDFKALSGAYGSFSDNLFLADVNILNRALVPVGQLSTVPGSSSGVSVAGGAGLRTAAQGASSEGYLERVDLSLLQGFHGAALTEAPVQSSVQKTLPTVGVIGQTILPFTRTLAVSADQSSILMLTISGITSVPANFDAPTPIPSISSVTNAADGTAAVAPGGLMQIAGTGLAQNPAAATTVPLPTALGDVCVTINGVAVPLFHVSSTNIMAQIPFITTGDATVLVHNTGGISFAFPFTISNQAPAVFHNGSAGGQTGLATVIRDDNAELVDFTNPIHPNQNITIYLTGMGITSPLPEAGDAAPASPLAVAAAAPQVTLGSVSLGVNYAGLVPGEIGVYQINASIPRVLEQGSSVPLTIRQGTASTTLLVRVVTP